MTDTDDDIAIKVAEVLSKTVERRCTACTLKHAPLWPMSDGTRRCEHRLPEPLEELPDGHW